jgi:hypothetical protein
MSDFIVGTFTEEGSLVSRGTLATASQHFPHSARLAARLAAAAIGEAGDDEQVTDQAVSAATRAVQLSPQNANHRILLALAKGLEGDTTGAETSLYDAIAHAPNDRQVRWRLANQLVRNDKIETALEHFRYAVANNPAWLPQTLDMLWQVTQGDSAILERVTGEAPSSRMTLAQFYLDQSQPQLAIAALAKVDRQAISALPQTPAFIESLMQAGNRATARQYWAFLVSGRQEQAPLVWNGGFEMPSINRLEHFDWKLKDSRFVAAAIDEQVAHSGQRSLRLQFLGRDTTQLTDEVQQLILLQPGRRYRLECFVQTKQFVIPEGPRLVLLKQADSQLLASSSPIAGTQTGWQRMAFEFTAPADTAAARLVLQRIPKFVYDEPAQGWLWLDDISLTEL